LKAAGIVPLRGDITSDDCFPVQGPAFDWLVHCVSSSGGNVAEYERVYFEGTKRLLTWLGTAPPAKFVYTGSTSVYGQTDGSWVDETCPVTPLAPTAHVLLRTEQVLLQAAAARQFPAILLRVAAIYGTGRAFWLDQVRRGAARIEGDGQRVLNMIHREDVVGVIIAALQEGQFGRVYNVVDDEPVAQEVMLQWLANRLRLPTPPTVQLELQTPSKRALTSKRVSNRRLKTELGYRCKFPTFRNGYEAILNAP
jgi:nucleoside-diphosphate-sugar epimerase